MDKNIKNITEDGRFMVFNDAFPYVYGVFDFGDYQYMMITPPSPDGSLYPDVPPIYARAICLADTTKVCKHTKALLYPMYSISWTTDKLYYEDETLKMWHPREWGNPNIVWLEGERF